MTGLARSTPTTLHLLETARISVERRETPSAYGLGTQPGVAPPNLRCHAEAVFRKESGLAFFLSLAILFNLRSVGQALLPVLKIRPRRIRRACQLLLARTQGQTPAPLRTLQGCATLSFKSGPAHRAREGCATLQ